MKIADLAALVSVRNHILVVINDKSVTNRADFAVLNTARMNLDKKFVEGVKGLNMDALFAVETRPVEVSPKTTLQIPLPFNTPEKDTDEEVKEAVEVLVKGDVAVLKSSLKKLEEQAVRLVPSVVESVADPIQAPEELKKDLVKASVEKPLMSVDQDPEFQEALKRQKELLSKQGRSNKRIQKDDTEKG